MNIRQTNLMRGMMLIGGELVPSESGEWLESLNPATEETLGHVPQGTAADVNRAVAAAEAAHPAWAALESKQRAKLLKKLAQKLRGDPSACASYDVSVPPLANDKTRLRNGEAARIRALGPQMHALAEINVQAGSGWGS